MSSFTSSPRLLNEPDIDELGSVEYDDEKDYDTEDASETDMAKRKEDFTPIKEQMYQDKLAQLKKQLLQLKEGTLPEYMKKLKKIELQYKERIRLNEIWLNYELELIEKEYVKEKKAAVKEFENKKIELKENLVAELEEKKRMVECERNTVELTGDSMEVKAVTTRKLRRRPNEPVPLPEKRRKPSPDQQAKKPQFSNEVDKSFFGKMEPKMGSRGKYSSLGAASAQVAPGGSVHGSQTSLAEKPWKKHHNRGKKEKQRRITGYLDA